MIKATAVAMAVLAAGALVAGFGLLSLPTPDPKPSPKLTPEEQYVQEVRDVLVGDEEVDDRMLISIGVTTCDLIELGMDDETIKGIATDNGFTARESTAVVEAAKKYICEQS